jgi:hypothetical protein
LRPKRPFLLLLGACITGGILGALANSVALWAWGRWGLAQWAGVALRPELTWPWLRPRLLWGAIWGAGFTPVAHLSRRGLTAAGLLYSLLPSAVQLFYVFPSLQGKGLMGLSLGTLTPAFVLAANAVFGIVLALWVALAAAES